MNSTLDVNAFTAELVRYACGARSRDDLDTMLELVPDRFMAARASGIVATEWAEVEKAHAAIHGATPSSAVIATQIDAATASPEARALLNATRMFAAVINDDPHVLADIAVAAADAGNQESALLLSTLITGFTIAYTRFTTCLFDL